MAKRSRENDAKPAGRRQRADGARSRQAILTAATQLATVEGLDGLSIARLAEHVGMRKSGVFAPLKLKGDLQLATIEAAAELYDREVTRPGMAAAIPGRVTSRSYSSAAASMVASCRSPFNLRGANTPLFLMPTCSASRAIDRPSSPSTVASWVAAVRMACRLRAPSA